MEKATEAGVGEVATRSIDSRLVQVAVVQAEKAEGKLQGASDRFEDYGDGSG